MADRRSAFQLLAAHRDRLPGVVFVQVPEGAESNSDWQRITELTEPYCGCPRRRALYPLKGRMRFASSSPPLMIPLTKEQGNDGDDSRALAFAPHGGDYDSAYVVWRYAGYTLIADEWERFALHPRMIIYFNMRLTETIPGRYCGQPAKLEQEIQECGEVMCTVRARGNVRLPICSVVEVTYTEGSRLPTVTFEVDASVKVIKINDYDRTAPRHGCSQ